MKDKRFDVLAAVAGGVAGLAAFGYYWLFRRPLPAKSGTVRLAGLNGQAEIVRDRWGVPHIYAESLEDLLFAQGYAHAQERLWQMDFNRRLVAGRLAEVLGEVAVPLDRWMRTLSMRRAAEEQAGLLSGEVRLAAEAFAAGVSARIAEGRLPVEFSLLRYQPEPWTPADQLAWAKLMAWTLSVNWETELLRARLIDRLGPEKAAGLEMPYFEEWPRVVPPGVDYSCIGAEALQQAAEARRFTGPAAAEGLGSNNWVLAPGRTATGLPLLANDMHLRLTAPAIWYVNHLVGGGLNVVGVSLPGAPGVVVGHNEGVAWGFTNGFPDVQDLYIEQIRRGADGSAEYLFQGEWLLAEVIREQINVKGGKAVVQEVIVTHHGPVINDLAPQICGGQPLALRWVALEPDNIFQALLDMNRARDCQEFREALRNWSAPSQNMVYADRQGNIGYSMPGKIPVRAKGDGRVPVPGWTGEYEWTGYIPFEELPHLYNPPAGFIVSANNRVVGEDYPHFLGYDHISGNRAQRITELIQAREKIGPDYIRRMQMDQVSAAARSVARSLGEMEISDPELREVVERMRAWDGNLAPGSPQAAVYEVFMQRLALRLLEGQLGDLAIRYSGKGPTPVLAELSLFGERSREWLQKVLANPDSPWYGSGDGDGHLRRDAVIDALRETVEQLKQASGPRFEDWSWGKLHLLTFSHSLGSQKPLDKIFNRGPYPIGGDFDTVWSTGASYTEVGDKPVIGPPFRFIADLSDWNKSLWILAPGQSGHPRSPHYADNIRGWLDGEYHPLPFDREAVLQAANARQVLEPDGG